MLINCEFQTDSLQRFMLDKCASSMHLALEISWILQAYIEDDNKETIKKCIKIKEDIEIAIVNSKRPDNQSTSPYTAISSDSLSTSIGESAKIEIVGEKEETITLQKDKEEESKESTVIDENLNQALSKRDRSIYFNQICQLIETLKNISDSLRSFPRESRRKIQKLKKISIFSKKTNQ